MRRRTVLTTALAASAGAALGGLGAATSASADYSTTVLPFVDWGRWDGWGTSLSWWAKFFGPRDDLASVLFTMDDAVDLQGQQVPALGLNIVRYNAGGSGPGMDLHGRTIDDRKLINGFQDENHKWQWDVDVNQVGMLRKAKARGADTFELFSTSPMWWMTHSRSSLGAVGGGENLKGGSFPRRHAAYLARVAAHARDDWGVRFGSVEPFNEPSAVWWDARTAIQEGCHFERDTMSAILPMVRQELDAVGLTGTILASPDENFYTAPAAREGDTLTTWNALTAAAKDVIGRINTHGYQGAGGDRDALYQAAVKAGKPIWNSETTDPDWWELPQQANPQGGIRMATNLNYDLTQLHPSGFVYWQAVDAEVVDTPNQNYGLVQADYETGNIVGPNIKYYVFAQYSRHIRPGMHLIESGDHNTVAAYDADAKKLVLVTVNYGTDQWVTYDLSQFGRVDGGPNGALDRWATETRSTAGDKHTHHADGFLDGKRFWSHFTPYAVQTFEITNVEP